MKHKIQIPYKISDIIKSDLESNLSYLSDVFKYYSVSSDGLIEYDLSSENTLSDAEKLVRSLIDKLKPDYEDEEIIIFDNTKFTPRNKEPTFQTLVDKKIVFEHMPGIFSFHDLFHDMYMALEKQVLDFADKENSRKIILPITTSIQSLQESSFFNRTPHFANFVSLLKNDGHSISEASKELMKSGDTQNIQKYLNNPTHMCRSAVCLSAYPLFRDSILSKSDYKTLTMRGKVFRNESSNVTTIERLHEFTQRDLVFFGDSDYVVKGLQSSVDWYKNYMEKFELKGKIQVASDPFFADNLKVLKFYQMAQQSKLEIRLFNPESERYISVGSINNHGSHYSKSFNIKLNEKDYATTGCVGFGYERLVYLFLCQYGLNTISWPQEAKEFWAI